MATGRAAVGRLGPGLAGPGNPGPRAVRAQTGLKSFYLRSFVQRKIEIFVSCLQVLLKIFKLLNFSSKAVKIVNIIFKIYDNFISVIFHIYFNC